MRALALLLSGSLTLVACSGGDADDDGAAPTPAPNPEHDVTVTYDQVFDGGEFHLGPVDWEESEWHNACAPPGGYSSQVRELEGDLLAGLWNGIPDVAAYCDACIHVTTAMGKQATLRVVTYGDTTPNSIDVSPQAHALLDSGEYPRAMSFQFVKCPDSGPILYEFQSGSNEWWTSLWVRNARAPLSRVEVKGERHSEFVELERASDGTLTDASGFGAGDFQLRLTALDGAQIVDGFPWPASGIAGQMLTGAGNF
jgi:expansin